jgi:RNA polymerase sigma factor (sigma-70 family)
VTQAVFVSLATNAKQLKRGTPLPAWLHVVTRRAAIDLLRQRSRREAREKAAVEMGIMHNDEPTWRRVEPILDEGVAALEEADRTAILLRFFARKSLREVGTALGASEDAVQKRISRALGKLQAHLARRGITVASAALCADLSAHAVQGAPGGLSAAIAASVPAALAKEAGGVLGWLTMTTVQKIGIGFAATGLLLVGVQRVRLAAAEWVRADAQATAAENRAARALVASYAAARQENQRLHQQLRAAPTGPTVPPRGSLSLKVPPELQLAAARESAEVEYRSLFSLFALPEAQRRALRDAIVTWSTGLDSNGQHISFGDGAQRDATLHGALAAMLPPDRAALLYTAVTDGTSWRKLRQLDERLRLEGEPLNESQLAPLLSALGGEMRRFAAPTNLADLGFAAEQKQASDDRLLAETAGTLSSEQLAAFREQLTDDLAEQRLALFAAVSARNRTAKMAGDSNR